MASRKSPRKRRGRVEEGVVRDLARGGDGVVQMPTGLWFVPDVAAGERIRAREIPSAGGIKRGQLVEVLEPSPGRVHPECPHQRLCGGCPWMHLSHALEAETKQRWVQELLERVGAADVRAKWMGGRSQSGYRTRARLHWERRGAHTLLGFRRARSRQVADIPDCRVLHPDLDAALGVLRACALQALTGRGEVSLAFGSDARPVVVLQTEDAQPPAVYEACRQLAAQADVALAGVALRVGEGAAPALWGDADERLTGFDGKPLDGTLAGFSQANAEVNSLLVAAAVELAQTEGAKVHELYAGHGNFSVALAPGSDDYVAVEQDPAAAARCADNLRARGLSARVTEGDALAHLGRGPLDVLVLDPPRTGAKGVLAQIQPRKPRRIVYVSCDLSTLERDLGELAGTPYRIDRALAFDMFPRTAQLETVVRLVRE